MRTLVSRISAAEHLVVVYFGPSAGAQVTGRTQVESLLVGAVDRTYRVYRPHGWRLGRADDRPPRRVRTRAADGGMGPRRR